MNDAERLAALAERLKSLGGLDEDTFNRLTTALEPAEQRFGYDARGLVIRQFGIISRNSHGPNDSWQWPDWMARVQSCTLWC